MGDIELNLSPHAVKVLRTALVERWEKQTEAMLDDLGRYLGGESSVHLEDAALKAQEIGILVDVLGEQLGWESVPGSGKLEVRERGSEASA
jgi:hypothetical protein